MRRTVLVLGMLLAATFFFGETLSSSDGLFAQPQARVQARSGDCDSDCDGTPDQLRLKDGSCQETISLDTECDGTQDQLQIHDQTNDYQHSKDGGDDGTQTRTGRA